MPRIDHRELQAGMVVAKEVLNSRGQLLIPGGTALTEKHLSALKMWGITSVDIDSGDAADEGANGAQVSQEVLCKIGDSNHLLPILCHPRRLEPRNPETGQGTSASETQ